MDSDSDDDVVAYRRVAKEMLHASCMKRLHGDFTSASRMRFHALVLLYESKPRFCIPRVRFEIDDVTDDSCLHFYRFTQRQLHRLQASFKLPDVIRTGSPSRTCCSGSEGLCITLHRLAYPSRWMEMSRIYGRWPSALSSIFYFVVDFISERCNVLLQGNLDYVSSRLGEFSQAVYDQGAELDHIWGFVDGTVRGICRPDGARAQQSVYSGHKRKHGLKFQTVVTPDGMIFHLYGPVEGRRHDVVLLHKSGIDARIRVDERFRGYFIYGDQAYGRTDVFVSPFKGSLTPAQAKINASMSKVRTTVEWSYGQVVNYWAGVDFKRKMYLGGVPAATLYKTGVVLTNCITILRGGNNNSKYFGVEPPSLQNYFCD